MVRKRNSGSFSFPSETNKRRISPPFFVSTFSPQPSAFIPLPSSLSPLPSSFFHPPLAPWLLRPIKEILLDLEDLKDFSPQATQIYHVAKGD
jgi:hypothetical protein